MKQGNVKNWGYFGSVSGWKTWGVSGAILMSAFWASVDRASAELVLVERGQTVPAVMGEDSGLQLPTQAADSLDSPAALDRLDHREVLGVGERAKSSLQARGGESNSPVVLIQSSPIASNTTAQSSDVAVENLSKSELMRRERMRTELQNEDALQERLEELRLRDEQRRTDEILTSQSSTQTLAAVSPPAIPQEVVMVPPTEGGGRSVTIMSPEMTSTATVSNGNADPNPVALTPRVGLSGMTASTGYDVQSRFTAGMGMSVGLIDNLAFELGYAYSEYGVLMSSSNPVVYNYQVYRNQSEPLVMKQNVIDAGLKLHILGPDMRLRPFIGGGGGWSKSFINYDARIIQALRASGLSNLTQDYDVSSFLGYLSGGVDVSVSRSIQLGVTGRYYAVLTARENSRLNNAAFLGYNGYYGYGGQGYNSPYYSNPYHSDVDKQVTGGSLSRSGFYTILATVTVTF